MKIICVGRNYTEHARELNNAVPVEPVIFMKPDTALLKDNKPFYLPDFSKDIHYEGEVVLRIGRNGKHIEEKFARKYVSEVTLGVDFTARDVQNRLKEKGLPWEIAKAFDQSAVVGRLLPAQDFPDLDNISFNLQKNSELVQQSNTSQMLFSCAKLISFISRYISLKTGDLLFTGTPAGVGKVAIGDRYSGYIGETEVFSFNVK